MSNRILVVAAHADDETLGCGATIRKHVEAGDEVHVLSLTDGVSSRDTSTGSDRSRRSKAAAEAAKILGFEWLEAGSFPDNAIDSVPLLDVVKFIENAKNTLRPKLVYTHHGGDLNVDHRIAFRATLTAFRPQPSETLQELRTFEVVSSTEWSDPTLGGDFVPNLFIDIADEWNQKRAAMEAYAEEMRSFPHARSIRAVNALSTWRGNQVGLPRAEAFGIIRRIES